MKAAPLSSATYDRIPQSAESVQSKCQGHYQGQLQRQYSYRFPGDAAQPTLRTRNGHA